MKLTANDINYIVSEATKRILKESHGIQEDYSIDLFEIEIPTYLEDELDRYSGPSEVHVVCTFSYDEGQEGDGYETENITPSYRLEGVMPGVNRELDSDLSPELFGAILKGAVKYVWAHSEEFEMDMLNQDGDVSYGPDEDEYRERKLGF